MPRDDHPGARIAKYRKLAGYTQRGLALQIDYSYSLVHQVERGHKAASTDFMAACARVLHVDVTALTGQPYMTELQQDRLAELIRPIRESLDLYDLGAHPDVATREAPQLVAAADTLCQQVRATQLNKAAQTLPRLIAELTTAAYRNPSTELWAALGSAYRTAHDVTVKLGFYDLSTIALDRMDWAAQRASDPVLSAVRQYMRGLVYHREGEQTIGLRLVNAGHHVLAQAEDTPESLAVAGQLHLGATVIAARARDEAAVKTHLREAKQIAKRAGDVEHVHWLSFGPTNWAAHELSALTELGLYGKAVEKAKKLRMPNSWPTSRRAHVWIDRGRCEMETGRTEAALTSIAEARRLAPQQTRYHPGARATIEGLVHQQRKTPDALGYMSAWLGL
ncbi:MULTISPECIES: helix-turn-helix domain-containing protein [Streptomyces]|uniref:helix-turn-helix domain-containing protein n=1 Tax=Streptomyces TaxID=1883 RepID=UPI001E311999|nr:MULTISPECIES: helix-turn-helix transcriptional regulator [Streptomyces]UFQ18244.1 helix-turn-helix domain-containing protein [Streptomyces huasconensis]WCL87857.1 helix-turn-helix transcriptional regulator [Streptomyces sp. JCM 35825]